MRPVRIRLSATAFREAETIARHLRAEAGATIEKRFAHELRRTLDLLADNPAMGRETSRPRVHVILLAHFPYHVVYRLPVLDELRILRIRHAHRRPLTWL